MLCRVERCGWVWGPAGQVSEKQEVGVGSCGQVKGETSLVKVKIPEVVHQAGSLSCICVLFSPPHSDGQKENNENISGEMKRDDLKTSAALSLI